MERVRLWLTGCLAAGVMACGSPAVTPARSMGLEQALSSPAEALEVEHREVRQELFKELCSKSQEEFGRPVSKPILFPRIQFSQVEAAQALKTRQDLFVGSDAGSTYQLVFEGDYRWPEDPREALFGLSEREAIDVVARSLLRHWGVQEASPIRVERSPKAPYAAAYVEGTLRVNPSFLYLAVTVIGASPGANLQ